MNSEDARGFVQVAIRFEYMWYVEGGSGLRDEGYVANESGEEVNDRS